MKRILILMSNTGGGHRASAEALKAGFVDQFGDGFQIDIIDLLIDHLPGPLNQLPPLYPWIANNTPWFWGLLFESGNYPNSVRRLVNALARYTAPRVSQAIAHFAPDLIVSVHPLVHEMTFSALRRLRRKVPVTTVVTDLATAHPLWYHPAVECCFVASHEAYQIGRQAGLQPAQLRLSGLPIRPAFARPPAPAASLRRELGLHPELPTALLIGGGDGMGPVAAIAQAVAHRLSANRRPLGQLVIVCGRNRRLREHLSAMQWPIPTVINGFVENMPIWMNASDCIITKAGPGTIAEALVCGLPIILSGFIPGQEEGNVPFVVENGVGLYSKDPNAIAATVWHWFGPGADQRRQMAEQARQLGRPHATYEIVQALAELVAEPVAMRRSA